MDYEKRIEKLRNPFVRGNEGCGVSMIDLLEKINEVIDVLNGEPELRESEDERIRKRLLWFLANYTGKWDYPETRMACCAWLEKQKEQKSIPIPHPCWESAIQEQKPVEKQDYSGLTDFERAIHRGFLCAGVENVPVTIIKETAQECLAQIKPAEWSEEDKKLIDDVLNSLCCYQGLLSDIYQKNIVGEKIKRLKSLRPHWKPTEEQMEALKNSTALTEKQGEALYSLIQDLKKLM